MNGKMTGRGTINKLTKGDRIYETAVEMSELLNENFRSVFTVEGVLQNQALKCNRKDWEKLWYRNRN